MTSTQTKLTFAKRMIGALTTMVVVACGGGGGGAGSGGGFLPDNNGTPTPSYTLTVSGKNAVGAATSEFSASSPLTIEVLVEDTSTNTASIVSGAVVDLTSTVGTITPANASALTNSNGVAQFGLEFNGEDGAGTVTATYSTGGTSYTAQFNVQSIVEDVATPVIALSLAATSSTGDTVTSLSQRSPTTITATFTSTLDGVITPLSGELVSLTTSVGDISPANGTALTDANGNAEFTIAFNGTEGAGPVSASADFEGANYSDTLNLQAVDTGAPYQIALSLRDASGSVSDILSASQPITVLATVRKIDGGLLIPVGAGELVELSTTIGALAGNGSALTNDNGVAEFELAFNGDIGAGSVTASFSSDQGAVTKTANLQSIATAVGYSLSLSATASAGMDALTFAAGSPIILTATLSSPSATVANQTVNLASSIGSIAPANGATLTDANGRASFEVSFNDLIGAGIATASYVTAEGSIIASINLEAVAAEIDTGLVISSFAPDGSASSEFSGDAPLTVTVQLTDAQGAPQTVSGQPISLTSSVGVLDAASKLTNAAGVATFELSSSGVVGAGELQASVVTDLGTVLESQSVQSVSDEPYSVTVVASGASVSLNQDITVTVTLRNPAGNVVPGEIIAVESSLGNLDRNSAVTNGAGQATFTLSYDGAVGAGIVTASYQNAGETFSNSVAYESRRPAAPTLVTRIEDQSGVATARLTSNEDLVVQITVRDRAGALVGAGETVSLVSTLGTVVGNGSALTDENGVATFTLQHDGTVGAGVITASYALDGETFVATRNVESVATDQNYSLTIAPAVNGAVFSADSALTVNVTLSSATGAAVANQIISLSSDIGAVAGNGKALTDGTGSATLSLGFGGVLGAGLVTASYTTDVGVVSDTANVVAVDNANDFGLSFNLSDPSGSFSLGNPLTVSVQITDAAGAPQILSGQIVELTAQIGVLDAASKLTDANGVATFELSSSGAIGAGLIEATLQTDLGAVREQQAVQSVSAEPFTLALSTVGGILSVGQDLVVTVTLTSPAGQPVAGEIISLATALGSLDKTSAVTDANGQANFTLSYTGQIGAGLITATFDSGLESFSNTATVEARAPVSPSVAVFTSVGGVASTQFDAASDMTVTVTVAGSADYGVSAGDSVSLVSTIGTVSGNGTALLVANAGNLEATFTVSSDGTVGAGSLTASITVDGVVFDASRNVSAAATDTNYQLTLYRADGTTALNGANLSASTPLTVIATLEDISTGAAVAVESELVSLTSNIGSLNQASGLTDANGDASFVLSSAGVIGAGVVTATYETSLGTVTAQANVSVISENAVSYTVGITNLSNGGTFSDAQPLSLTVTVKASDLSDLAGELVALSSDLGAVVGNGFAVLGAGVAGEHSATFQVDYAGVVGAGTLTASYVAGGETTIATQSVQTEASDAYSLTITPDVATVTVGTPMTLTVGLRDSAGAAVANQSVGLSSTIGSLNRVTGITDAAGDTTFVLSSAGVGGDGLVTATYTVDGNTYTQTQRVVVAEAVSPTVTIATAVGGVASTQFDAASDMTVTVTVAGSADYGVSAGDSVSLVSTIGTVSGNGTALLVDNAGDLEATFTVSSDGTVGAGTLTVSIDVGGTVFSATKGVESLGAPYELSALTFVDSTSAALANAIVSSVAPYRSITASVTLTDLGGNALENRLIQFVSAKGQLTPIDGYVLTDATGVADVTIAYTDDIISGIGELSAGYVSALGTVSVVADVQAIAPNLLVGTIDGINFTEADLASTPASGSLVNQGSALLQLDIVNSNLDITNASDTDRIKSAQAVAFSSFCLDNGLSTLSPASPITTSSGQLSATYTAGAGCTGDDEVIATLQFGGSATAQTASQVLTIAAAVEAVSIEFVDVTPTTLAIAGTGALSNVSETAVAQFRVVDGNGSPVQGETVNFSLSSTVGGLSLSTVSALSGADGLVSVSLNSGNVPTSTLITAELDSTGQLVSSALVTVSTAIPDQNSFTIFSDNLSVSQAYPAVNQTSSISVRLADRYNNVVPDGSVVYFTTEYGAIDASCSIVAGECSVVWRSQAPKPIGSNLSTVDCPDYDNDGDGTANNDALGAFDPCPSSSLTGIEQGSRTTILATTTGEESFLDVDGDGLMSDFLNEFIDAQHDLGEPYLDANEDGAYQINEFFVDDNSSGSREDGDNLYTGIGCTAATLGTGDCTGSTLSVFDNIALILSPSDNLYIAMVDTSTAPDSLVPNGGNVAAGSYVAYFSDQYNNQPANGATVTVSATGDCSIVSPTTFTVPNNNAANAYQIGIEIASVAATAGADTVSVSIANPGAATVTQTFTCIP